MKFHHDFKCDQFSVKCGLFQDVRLYVRVLKQNGYPRYNWEVIIATMFTLYNLETEEERSPKQILHFASK